MEAFHAKHGDRYEVVTTMDPAHVETPDLAKTYAVAGFTGHGRVKTSTLVDAGGKLPLVLTFIDKEEHVERVLPQIKKMAGHRLIVREKVVIEGEAD